MASKDIVQQLEAERESLAQRLAAVDQALEALTGTAATTGLRRRIGASSVGQDKLDAIMAYIRDRGSVAQKEIVADLGYTSGAVSLGAHALAIAGKIEQVGKVGRSPVWQPKK